MTDTAPQRLSSSSIGSSDDMSFSIIGRSGPRTEGCLRSVSTKNCSTTKSSSSSTRSFSSSLPATLVKSSPRQALPPPNKGSHIGGRPIGLKPPPPGRWSNRTLILLSSCVGASVSGLGQADLMSVVGTMGAYICSTNDIVPQQTFMIGINQGYRSGKQQGILEAHLAKEPKEPSQLDPVLATTGA
jgi:hypothetical protein